MKKRSFTLNNKHGLHLRPATDFVKLTSDFEGEVWLRKGEIEVNAKSILGILSLGIDCGDTVEISFEGEEPEAFFEKLEEFFDRRE